MAKTTRNVVTNKSAYIREDYPTTHYSTSGSGSYLIQGRHLSNKAKYLLFGIPSWPSSLKHNVIYGASLKVQMWGGTGIGAVYAYILNADFNSNTVTYKTRPSIGDQIGHSSPPNPSGAYADYWIPAASWTSTDIALNLLRSKGFAITRDNDNNGDTNDDWWAKTVLSNNGGNAFVQVQYDDTTKVKSAVQIKSYPSGTVDSRKAITFSWALKKDSNTSRYCYDETWTQASAKIYWKASTDNSWNTINISGSTMSKSVAGYTFPSGKTIQWYLEVTDDDGETPKYGSSSTPKTFKTPATQLTQVNCPTSGYRDPRQAIKFSWSYSSSVGAFNSGSTVIHWRAGTSGSYTTVTKSAGTTSHTFAASTFPTASTIQWYLSGTDATGATSQTPVYSFSTAAGTISASPVSPVNAVETNNNAITFRWTLTSSDGYPASRVIVLWKKASDPDSAGYWNTIVNEESPITSATLAANTLPSGEIDWKVIPYNYDEIEGTTGSASFISYGAPLEPAVYCSEVPFATVTWQADEQQAYQIQVDDRTYGPYFGTEKTFVLPDYLTDGEHTARVRVMGVFGMWSNWGETDVIIANEPDADINLTATACTDTELAWETPGTFDCFFVYRDGKQIAKTDKFSFVDRLAIGEHSYSVIGKLASGNYSTTSLVYRSMKVANPKIALLAGGDWLDIRYRISGEHDPQTSDTINTVYNHYSGDTYVSAVLGNRIDSNVTYSAVFLFNQVNENRRFEQMFGKPVIFKFSNDTVFAAIIDSWTRTQKKGYYYSYSFTLHRIELEDYIDDTGTENPI